MSESPRLPFENEVRGLKKEKILSWLRQIPGAATAYWFGRWLHGQLWFRADFREFRRQSAAGAFPRRFPVRWSQRFAQLYDRTATTRFDRHYVYHTAWAARVLARTQPKKHIDIASSLYFVGIVSAFVPTEFYDYRPAELLLSNLRSGAADLLKLPLADRSVESISCMHVIEHVGLGRYGDPLDPDADLRAMRELQRVVAPGGSLLIVVPVGRPRLMFNAHRIYAQAQIVHAFVELDLVEFTLIADDEIGGGLISPALPQQVEAQRYGCGCFWFRRPA